MNLFTITPAPDEGERASALDEIANAYASVGGTDRGRRYATQQINHAYATLLSSHFQGFCRDLHSECVEHVVAATPSIAHQDFDAARLGGTTTLHLAKVRLWRSAVSRLSRRGGCRL